MCGEGRRWLIVTASWLNVPSPLVGLDTVQAIQRFRCAFTKIITYFYSFVNPLRVLIYYSARGQCYACHLSGVVQGHSVGVGV